jgi:hypothetical protein
VGLHDGPGLSRRSVRLPVGNRLIENSASDKDLHILLTDMQSDQRSATLTKQ